MSYPARAEGLVNMIKIIQNSEKSPGDEDAYCHLDFSERPPANVGMKNSYDNNNSYSNEKWQWYQL